MIENQLSIFDILTDGVPEELVPIKGVINLKAHPICDYDVHLTYGDLVLIVAIMRDYVRGFDKLVATNQSPLHPMEYECYYRNKFLGIAEKISSQIDYDYEAKLKKCTKKAKDDDIGEDALVLALKKGASKLAAEMKSEEEQDGEREGTTEVDNRDSGTDEGGNVQPLLQVSEPTGAGGQD